MAFGILWQTLLGAGLAVTGGFAAKRYEQLIELRIQHKNELVGGPLAEWRKEARKELQRSLGSSVAPNQTGKGFYCRDRANDFVLSAQSGAEGCVSHWPALAQEWSLAQETLQISDSRVIEFLEHIANEIGNPPPEAAFSYFDKDRPSYGKHLVACTLWTKWAAYSHQPNLQGFKDWLQRESIFNPKEADGLEVLWRQRVLELFERSKNALDQISKAHKEAQHRLETFLRMVEQVSLSKNIHGRCRLCPPILPKPW